MFTKDVSKLIECRSEIELSSTISTLNGFKALGQYKIKPNEYIENHPVYKHEGSDEHIAFSGNYGWTVLQKTFIVIYEHKEIVN